MLEYTVVISRTARKQLDKLSDDVAEPIFKALENLELNPRPHGCKKLKGRDGYRIRVGDYRIIYDIYDKILTIEVVALGHRRDIYD